MADDARWRRPRGIVVDVRKFSDYVLDPAKARGKDGVFINLLGFRALHRGDAAELAALYARRAREAIDAGDIEVGRPTIFGLRCTIAVTVRGVALRSGWLLEPDGQLRLVTPFSGFVPGRKEPP
jgi:hypothetical protein